MNRKSSLYFSTNADFLDVGFAVPQAGAFVSAEGINLLAAPVIGLKESEDAHWHSSPPIGIAEINYVVAGDVWKNFELRAGVSSEFGLGFVRTLGVVESVGFDGIELEHFRAGKFVDELGDDFGVAFSEVFYAAVDVIIAFA